MTRRGNTRAVVPPAGCRSASGGHRPLLCSADAGWITGQTIAVGGGLSLMDAGLLLEIQRG